MQNPVLLVDVEHFAQRLSTTDIQNLSLSFWNYCRWSAMQAAVPSVIRPLVCINSCWTSFSFIVRMTSRSFHVFDTHETIFFSHFHMFNEINFRVSNVVIENPSYRSCKSETDPRSLTSRTQNIVLRFSENLRFTSSSVLCDFCSVLLRRVFVQHRARGNREGLLWRYHCNYESDLCWLRLTTCRIKPHILSQSTPKDRAIAFWISPASGAWLRINHSQK